MLCKLSSMMLGHGECVMQGRAGGVQAWCTWTRVSMCRCVQQNVGGKALAGNVWGWLIECWGVWWLCRWVLDITRSLGKICGSGGVGMGCDRGNAGREEFPLKKNREEAGQAGGALCSKLSFGIGSLIWNKIGMTWSPD